jgi:hypothetical protein
MFRVSRFTLGQEVRKLCKIVCDITSTVQVWIILLKTLIVVAIKNSISSSRFQEVLQVKFDLSTREARNAKRKTSYYVEIH